MFVALVGYALTPPIANANKNALLITEVTKNVALPFTMVTITHKHLIKWLELMFGFFVAHSKLTPITLVFRGEERMFCICYVKFSLKKDYEYPK